MAVQRRRMLADQVYDELMVALVDGRYESDTALNIDALARELDVSQTPVREALVRLESTGLVIRTALKGYRVAPMMTAQDWVELTDARMVLETENARRSCERSDEGFIGELEATLDQMKLAPIGTSFQDFRYFWEADETFHQLIAVRAGNQFLLNAFETLGSQVQRFRLFAGLGVVDAKHAIAEHSQILDAFKSGDPERARKAMEHHIHGVRQRVVSETLEREAKEELETGAPAVLDDIRP